jgi:sulfur-oxidizing protein SoxX
MKTKLILGLGIAALAAAPFALAEPTAEEVVALQMRDFHKRGQAGMDRLEQDAVQRVCTDSHNKPPEAVAKAMESDQLRAIPFPSGKLIGDWKKGAKVAAGGRGMTWRDDPKKPSGGGCYNCHQLSPSQPSYGTIGPSLTGFAKKRGNGPDMQKYVYGKVYNAKAYSLCSNMPRFGSSGTLTEEQIKDVVAYVLDSNSPVNK